MLKKTLRWIFKILISIILLIVLAYGLFHLIEYATGGKYVKYLKANSETITLDMSFSYEIMKSDIEKHKLILVGESHGFDQPQKFDIHFFKYLNEHHDVDHYVAELDFLQAQLMNAYLKSGDEELLKTALKKWVVAQGRNNKDYFDKYRALHQYYRQLPDDDKFIFIGIDKIQDYGLSAAYLSELLESDIKLNSKSIKNGQILDQVDSLLNHIPDSTNNFFILSHLRKNLAYVQEGMNREEVLYRNFSTLYRHFQLQHSKVYGFFGLYHVFQYRVNGNDPLASKIRQSDLNLEDRMLSINFAMVDSDMVMPSKQLPKFMQDEGAYTRMPISADNLLFMYVWGIKDFKRMTPAHHKSLIRMNGDNNPYVDSRRLSTSFQLLPVTDLFKMNDRGKPYVQYTVFVRNSDWAEPTGN